MDEELVKNQIEQIALEYPRYGYRRITEELKRRDFIVNHKRVLKLMQEEDLLCKHKKKFMVTTDSNHPLPIYPNLIKGMIVTRINQIWVADITYIPLTTGKFVFLAVVLDLYSRKVVGWHLGSDLSSILVCHALQMAILSRKPPAGLTHHSDRGVQYASYEYTNILKLNNIQISMSRKGNPYDNAVCESFNKTFKWDEVRLNKYNNYFEAKEAIANYIEQIYNAKRLHSSLNYRPPNEFEESLINSQLSVRY
ncbi:MAG: Integrase, catalytic region [Candidatus Woesebacteria bacterium GW2011_GWA2_40_7]|uniref:Integrase, catalytic region n=3 Tax=Candidatus Woeseibacteriota TaxID=1752722 RepID=A0A0G0UYL9_9BACT|nr:MAG: Integrase, catalytic region [Candidatus Woesebacteria bacterium GW2011_GWB1_39_10]KKR73636.1 MAG: Integrase, catalytic region [Candidatus Woesebacteria bacterium GW2011_GWA2_40_7]KKR92606.1 MAG: Integrase, catalytic region [Candidatus Woesebacteria bacterium GW2011_GWA1_41_13b]